MKRMLMVSVAAICIACGVSAYKPVPRSGVITWFKWIIKILKRLPPWPLPPTDNSGIVHPLYGRTTRGTYPSNPCSGGTYWCLAGFTVGQLTAGGNFLNTVAGSQTPVTAVYSQN
jgi:hypothetical protein